MIEFKTNQQLDAEEAAQLQAEKDAKDRQQRSVVTSLAGYVRDCWEASKEAKQPIEKVMIDSLRRKNGIYDPTKLAKIREHGGSEIFMMLTDEKCSAISSWLSDILFPADDKPWGIKPTPVPDLRPEQVMKIKQQIVAEAQSDIKQDLMIQMQAGQIQGEEQARQFMLQAMQARLEELSGEIRSEMEKVAKEARDKIETKLHDVVTESGWKKAVKESLDDIATFPAGIVKGPVLRRKKKLKWVTPQQEQGQSQGQLDAGFQGKEMPMVQVTNETCIDFNRVSPFDIYPLPNARTPEDGIIERHRLTRRFLTSLIGVQGYDEDAIRMVLAEYGNSGQSTWLSIANDLTRQTLENRPNEWRSPETMIDALQFWGNVQGLKLLQYGMSPEEVEDPFADYSVEVWLIGHIVIKAEINGDPMGRVPYNFASFRKRNGSIWGAGAPEVFKDAQDACNAAARNLINNMGIASGPQVMVDVSQLPVGANVTDMYPWKLWQVNSERAMGGSSKPPLSFFVPPSVAKELIEVYQFFSAEADNKTGIPKYSYGGEAKGGALGTATGFSMMMGNAARGIKSVVGNIDEGIIEPTIERTHEFQLLFFRDPEYYIGDIKIIARGSSTMVAKEQAAVRRNELLQIVVSSPDVLSVIGEVGLASMLHDIFKAADFKDNDIVPDKKEMLRREKQNQLLMQQQAQIEQDAGQQPGKGKQTDPAGNVAGGRDARTV
ncbi:hypothetical protein [Desulfobacula sp.]|uniref:portal protein n=1 Tax=Desulfobacula sp. TaxID=2593537 RepID=UPI00260F9E2E|nr:hypothetical protein [Desulfobacula sp.]